MFGANCQQRRYTTNGIKAVGVCSGTVVRYSRYNNATNEGDKATTKEEERLAAGRQNGPASMQVGFVWLLAVGTTGMNNKESTETAAVNSKPQGKNLLRAL